MDDQKSRIKKVLMLANMPDGGRYRGGITYIAEEIFKNKASFEEQGYEIELFNTEMIQRKSDSENKWEYENIANALMLNGSVKKQIKKNKYDILYMHGSYGLGLFKFCYLVRSIRRRFKGDIVLHIHFSELAKILPKRKILAGYILKTLKNYVDKVIFLSYKTKEEFVGAGVSEKKSNVLYNFQTIAVSKEEIAKKIENIGAKDKADLLFVGSIDKRKGIIDLLESIKKVKDDNFVLHICGMMNDHSIEEKFNGLVQELGSKAVFHGYINGVEKDEMFKKADMLILPSYGEGLPIVILEAMGSACAIVSTNVGVMPEIIVHKKEGFLLEPSDINSLTNTLNNLVSDRTLLGKYMQNSYDASEQYHIKNFIDNLVRVFGK